MSAPTSAATAPLAGGDAGDRSPSRPGVTIFASSGNDYLVVNRGSRINAIGTAAQPIIFTARANVEGTATDASQGLWGGIILLGRAPISDCNTAVPGGSANCQQVIEGTTGSLYGGALATDNSGTLQFVQIRYSGFAIAPGNELQGLTLGGVGNSHHDRPYPGPQQLGRRHRDFRRPAEPQASRDHRRRRRQSRHRPRLSRHHPVRDRRPEADAATAIR